MKFSFLELGSSEINFKSYKGKMPPEKPQPSRCPVIGMKVLKHSCFLIVPIFFKWNWCCKLGLRVIETVT